MIGEINEKDIRTYHLGKGSCDPCEVEFEGGEGVMFMGRLLYYSQARCPKGDYVVVPGFDALIQSGKEGEVRVAPIVDEGLREKVSEFLGSRTEGGKFVFWW